MAKIMRLYKLTVNGSGYTYLIPEEIRENIVGKNTTPGVFDLAGYTPLSTSDDGKTLSVRELKPKEAAINLTQITDVRLYWSNEVEIVKGD